VKPGSSQSSGAWRGCEPARAARTRACQSTLGGTVRGGAPSAADASAVRGSPRRASVVGAGSADGALSARAVSTDGAASPAAAGPARAGAPPFAPAARAGSLDVTPPVAVPRPDSRGSFVATTLTAPRSAAAAGAALDAALGELSGVQQARQLGARQFRHL